MVNSFIQKNLIYNAIELHYIFEFDNIIQFLLIPSSCFKDRWVVSWFYDSIGLPLSPCILPRGKEEDGQDVLTRFDVKLVETSNHELPSLSKHNIIQIHNNVVWD